jgi:hypothetical protein
LREISQIIDLTPDGYPAINIKVLNFVNRHVFSFLDTEPTVSHIPYEERNKNICRKTFLPLEITPVTSAGQNQPGSVIRFEVIPATIWVYSSVVGHSVDVGPFWRLAVFWVAWDYSSTWGSLQLFGVIPVNRGHSSSLRSLWCLRVAPELRIHFGASASLLRSDALGHSGVSCSIRSLGITLVQRCFGVTLLLKVAWTWPFFSSPNFAKTSLGDIFCFHSDLLNFSHGVSWRQLLKSSRTNFWYSAYKSRVDLSKLALFKILRFFQKHHIESYIFLHGFSPFLAWSYFRTWTLIWKHGFLFSAWKSCDDLTLVIGVLRR